MKKLACKICNALSWKFARQQKFSIERANLVTSYDDASEWNAFSYSYLYFIYQNSKML